MVDGRWETRGLWGMSILIRMRGFCAVGFFMQFLIFGLDDRSAQSPLAPRWSMVDGGVSAAPPSSSERGGFASLGSSCNF